MKITLTNRIEGPLSIEVLKEAINQMKEVVTNHGGIWDNGRVKTEQFKGDAGKLYCKALKKGETCLVVTFDGPKLEKVQFEG